MTDFHHGSRTDRTTYRGTALLMLAILVTACDSAGTVLDDTARLAAVEQCRQVSEGAGIAGPAVTRVCNCAADTWLAKPVAERIQLDPATIRGIISECAGTDTSTDAGTDTNTGTDPATESY